MYSRYERKSNDLYLSCCSDVVLGVRIDSMKLLLALCRFYLSLSNYSIQSVNVADKCGDECFVNCLMMSI